MFVEPFAGPRRWRNVYSARETNACVGKNPFSPVYTEHSSITVAFKNIALFSTPVRAQVFSFLKAGIWIEVGLTS